MYPPFFQIMPTVMFSFTDFKIFIMYSNDLRNYTKEVQISAKRAEVLEDLSFYKCSEPAIFFGVP